MSELLSSHWKPKIMTQPVTRSCNVEDDAQTDCSEMTPCVEHRYEVLFDPDGNV